MCGFLGTFRHGNNEVVGGFGSGKQKRDPGGAEGSALGMARMGMSHRGASRWTWPRGLQVAQDQLPRSDYAGTVSAGSGAAQSSSSPGSGHKLGLYVPP